ncbi:hypothetical protein FGO68_gene14478 [Halteria grandinella]|uniref:Uncharacterized protein n=1 Tax=Halteria grandinella TaxID=5974 RepID=A0A8J8NPC1_HALGN|nr:hypothetical protein FGO68_gene14478 [Halteria grandinella]
MKKVLQYYIMEGPRSVVHVGRLFQKQSLLVTLFSFLPRNLRMKLLNSVNPSFREYLIQYFKVHSRYVRVDIDEIAERLLTRPDFPTESNNMNMVARTISYSEKFKRFYVGSDDKFISMYDQEVKLLKKQQLPSNPQASACMDVYVLIGFYDCLGVFSAESVTPLFAIRTVATAWGLTLHPDNDTVIVYSDLGVIQVVSIAQKVSLCHKNLSIQGSRVAFVNSCCLTNNQIVEKGFEVAAGTDFGIVFCRVFRGEITQIEEYLPGNEIQNIHHMGKQQYLIAIHGDDRLGIFDRINQRVVNRIMNPHSMGRVTEIQPLISQKNEERRYYLVKNQKSMVIINTDYLQSNCIKMQNTHATPNSIAQRTIERKIEIKALFNQINEEGVQVYLHTFSIEGQLL